MKTAFKKRRGSKVPSFNPSRFDLEKAMTDYIKNGGQITKLVPEDAEPSFITDASADRIFSADDFLLGR